MFHYSNEGAEKNLPKLKAIFKELEETIGVGLLTKKMC